MWLNVPRVDGGLHCPLEFDALLKRRNVDAHAYNIEDLEQDLETLERLEASGLMPRS